MVTRLSSSLGLFVVRIHKETPYIIVTSIAVHTMLQIAIKACAKWQIVLCQTNDVIYGISK